jgi:hypothetical protein
MAIRLISSTAAPSRGTVGKPAIWFGLLAAPCAWLAGEMAGYFIASQLCSAKSSGMPALVTATSPWFVACGIVPFLLAIAGLIVACGNWRKTRHTWRDAGHPRRHPGEGPTRFLSLCGLLISIGFCIAFLFTAAYMVGAPLCEK